MSVTSSECNEHKIDMTLQPPPLQSQSQPQLEISQPLLQRPQSQSQSQSPPLQPQPQPQPQSQSLWYCCIYKVPQTLRMVNPDAYTPQLISIGPIHHGKDELKSMEDLKKSYSDSFWKDRVRNEEHRKDYISCLVKEKQNIRSCYLDEFPDHINGDKFVEIILLDSVFIMELFLRFNDDKQDDFILSNAWRSSFIQRDLFLLENQLPIPVLEELYKFWPVPDRCFRAIAEMYFESYYPKDASLMSKLKTPDETAHFTELVRWSYVPKQMERDFPLSPAESQVLKSAIKLKKAGITFEANPEKSLLEIKFEKGCLSKVLLCFSCISFLNCVKARLLLPSFHIDESTEWILRNLMAFEQFHYPEHTYICNYITFLDCLIQSEEDVDLLVENQVIEHYLGSDREAATLVNGLCKNIVIVKTCYNDIIHEVNEHYSSRWNLAMGELRWVYYRDLWRGSSTIVGLAVLFFTFYNFFSTVFN